MALCMVISGEPGLRGCRRGIVGVFVAHERGTRYSKHRPDLLRFHARRCAVSATCNTRESLKVILNKKQRRRDGRANRTVGLTAAWLRD